MNRFVSCIQEGQRVFFEAPSSPGIITSGIIRRIRIEDVADGDMKKVLTISISPQELIQKDAYHVFLDEVSYVYFFFPDTSFKTLPFISLNHVYVLL